MFLVAVIFVRNLKFASPNVSTGVDTLMGDHHSGTEALWSSFLPKSKICTKIQYLKQGTQVNVLLEFGTNAAKTIEKTSLPDALKLSLCKLAAANLLMKYSN